MLRACSLLYVELLLQTGREWIWEKKVDAIAKNCGDKQRLGEDAFARAFRSSAERFG